MTWREAFEEWWRVLSEPDIGLVTGNHKELYAQAFRQGFIVGSREVFKSQRANSNTP